jgi:hypothetical protein
MSPASSDASMLAVAVPAPLRPTLLGDFYYFDHEIDGLL